MKFRKILFWAHLCTGCAAGAVILIMSVTGILLAYQRQWIAWIDHDLRVASPAGNVPRLAMDALVQNVSSIEGTPPTAITLRSEQSAPVEISFGRERVYLVDPYSGRLLGESAPRTRAFLQGVENIHRWLGTPPEK